jgi:hypothetical protein
LGGFGITMSGVRDLLFEAARLAGASVESGSAGSQRTFLLEALVSIGRSDLVEPMTIFLDGGDDAGAYMSKTDDLVALDDFFGVSILGSSDD